jgi:hypothetical protein
MPYYGKLYHDSLRDRYKKQNKTEIYEAHLPDIFKNISLLTRIGHR